MQILLHEASLPQVTFDAASVAHLNNMSMIQASDLLMRCSHSLLWTDCLLNHMPFAAAGDLDRASIDGWQSATRDNWLEAFAGHPLIGDVEYLRRRFDAQAHGEQGQVLAATTDVLEELATLNREYLARHGFIFIIRASGLSAAQMLDTLRQRIVRSTDIEFVEAATQHASITRLRLAEALRS